MADREGGSATQTVYAPYWARQRGEPEPPTVINAVGGDGALAGRAERERGLETLLAEARKELMSARRRLLATELSVDRLVGQVTDLERERLERLEQVADLHERLRQPSPAELRVPAGRPPGLNRAARRQANRKHGG